ncbi:hypothetical protein JD844_021279 [Phrynosoma platyrhinos]|uniref:Receptor protein-tyrosine kinase n=1 Tax=Phrynosoma platyrhinos TaxID=52577 RepID=A0ABQ7STD1_PHRPL|nr:hypothetical protein JD844_021279 [Phrynosoma platyrhinos]
MPVKLKVSQGQPVKLNCSLEGMEDPEMLWIKDGAVVKSVDQVYIPVDEEHWIGFLSLKSVDRTDSGKYWCQIETNGKKEESQQVWLIVEGRCLSFAAVCRRAQVYHSNSHKANHVRPVLYLEGILQLQQGYIADAVGSILLSDSQMNQCPSMGSEFCAASYTCVPYFTVEPEDLSVIPNTPFHMVCAAAGPPEPVTIVWWMGDSRVGLPDVSPSTLNVSGINQSTVFSCEAHNIRGLSSSRTATVHIKALPFPPLNVTVTQITSNNAIITWLPGFDGLSPLHSCTVQVAESQLEEEMATEVVPALSFSRALLGLKHSTNYSVRVQCTNEMGSSPFTDWVYFQTLGLAPNSTPQNVHIIQRDSCLILEWEPVAPEILRDNALGYRLEWSQDNITQGEMVVQEARANLTMWNPLKDLLIRVCILNSAGCGPWSEPLMVTAEDLIEGQRQPPYGTSWVPVVLGILTALVTAVSLALILLRKRRKETRFGHAFGSMVGGDPVVHFRAVRSFNREVPELIEATLDSIGISDELKTKLKDVLIQEQQFTLGRMLGKGEFGSVREGQLKLPDGSLQKVAVKMLKADIFTSSDIEEFLKEAACMKEFDHPHVTKLIGIHIG